MREWIVAGAIFVLAVGYLVAAAVRERRAARSRKGNGRWPQ